MKILVDADACPVKEIIVRAAKKYEKEVLMVCDVAHQLFYEEPFVTVKTVDKGADSADLVQMCIRDRETIGSIHTKGRCSYGKFHSYF